MTILHIIPGISKTSGGPSRTSQGLVSAQNNAGITSYLFSCSGDREPWILDPSRFIITKSRDAKTVRREFEEAVAKLKPDLIHIHSLWLWCCHIAAAVARKHGIPYVIAPRGSLEPWALRHKWLRKKLAMLLFQRRDLRLAAALHATAESEVEHFRRLGFTQEIILSPNGVNVPECLPPRANRSDGGSRRALFLSRMHVGKGVLELVEAWARVRPVNWVCELVYTANREIEKEYEAKVKARVKELGLEDQFIFTGMLDDNAKWKAYRRADVFVLPTYSENFGVVVTEAMFAELPVITTKGAPWKEIDGQCGYWIDIGVEPLADALRAMMDLSDDERERMGKRGRELVESKYCWPAIASNMLTAYSKICGCTSQNPFS